MLCNQLGAALLHITVQYVEYSAAGGVSSGQRWLCIKMLTEDETRCVWFTWICRARALTAASRFSTVCHFSTVHYETHYSSLITFGETDGERGLKRTSSKTHLGGLITSKLCLISTGSYIPVQHAEERETSRGSGMSVFAYECTWSPARSAALRSCFRLAL